MVHSPIQISVESSNKTISFFNKDIEGALIPYIAQLVKRAEYVKRFGKEGKKLQEMLEEAEEFGLTSHQRKAVDQYVNAMLGKHGVDTNRWLADKLNYDMVEGQVIHPKLQKAMSSLIILRNFAILGLATFTSFADVMGIMVRGGDIDTAFTTFKSGMNEFINSVSGSERKTRLREIAEALGTIETYVNHEALNDYYGQSYLSSGLKKWNDKFFDIIGLNKWTRFTRLIALGAGEGFLAKHKSLPTPNSERFLDQLNIHSNDIVLDGQRKLKLLTNMERNPDSNQYVGKEEVARDDKVRTALNRFVDQAILRPNPAQRTIWMSDPHFMLAAHLKSFTFGFHDTILRRVHSEAMEGNYAPFLLLWSFVPVMLASDWLREKIQYGGGSAPYKADWGAGDHIYNAMQRSGLFGIGQLAIDAGRDVSYGGVGIQSFAGPTAQNLKKIDDLLFDSDAGRMNAFVSQLPFQNIWKHYLI
jgi:hypothetical protein